MDNLLRQSSDRNSVAHYRRTGQILEALRNKKILLIAVIASVGLGILLAVTSKTAFSFGAALLLVALFISFVKLLRETKNNTLIKLAVFSLFLRVVVALISNHINLIQEADALSYQKNAVFIANSWLNGYYRVPAMSSAYGYIYFVSFLYAGIVSEKMIPIIINCFVGVAAGIYIYRIAIHVWKDERIATYAAFFALFMPGILIWSTGNLKDTWANLLLIISIYYLLKIREEGPGANRVVGVLLCIALLWTIRFYLSILLIPMLVFALGAAKRRSFIYISILFMVVLTISIVSFAGTEVRGVTIGLETLDTSRRELAAAGGSETGEIRRVTSIGEAVAFFPIGLAYFFFAPFPWSAPTSTLYLLTLPEMVIIYIMWVFIVIGLVRAIKRKSSGAEIILIFVTAATVLYSLGAGNIGTLYRMRTPIMLLLFVFAAEPISRAFIVKREAGRSLRNAVIY